MTSNSPYTFYATIRVEDGQEEPFDVSGMGDSVEEILSHLEQRLRAAPDTREVLEVEAVETDPSSLQQEGWLYYVRDRKGVRETVRIAVEGEHEHPPFLDAPVGDCPITLYTSHGGRLSLVAMPNMSSSETPDVTIVGVPCRLDGSPEFVEKARKMLRSGRAAGDAWDGVDEVTIDYLPWYYTDERDALGDVLSVMLTVVGPRHVRNVAAQEAILRAIPVLRTVYKYVQKYQKMAMKSR